MTPDRIAELRKWNSIECEGIYCPTKDGACKITHECLDSIEALQADNARLREALDGWNKATDLGCDHCGGIAALSWVNVFWDGEQHHCVTCGMAGQIHADEDRAHWSQSDDSDDKCEEATCAECRPALADGGGK